MSANHTSIAQPNVELNVVNDILIRLGIPAVSSLTNILSGTDVAVVHQMLHQNLRKVGSKGWFCFNRADEIECTVDVDGNIPIGAPVLLATPSSKTINHLYRHDIKAIYRLSADRASLVPRIPPLATKARELRLQKVWYDIIFDTPIFDLGTGASLVPDAFINYCAYLTYSEMALAFGVVPDPDMLGRMELELFSVEGQHTPRRNVFHNPNIARTWLRRS